MKKNLKSVKILHNYGDESPLAPLFLAHLVWTACRRVGLENKDNAADLGVYICHVQLGLHDGDH